MLGVVLMFVIGCKLCLFRKGSLFVEVSYLFLLVNKEYRLKDCMFSEKGTRSLSGSSSQVSESGIYQLLHRTL